MKRSILSLGALIAVFFVVLLSSAVAVAQAPTWDCNGATGTYTLAGTQIKATCPTATTGGNTGGGGGTNSGPCTESQVSTALGGKTFKRQCSGRVAMMPSTIPPYAGQLTDLGAVLGNSTFPAYKYAGYSPTFTIKSGYYVALSFTPSTSGAFQLVANTSYGDGGTISLSTVAGAITRGATGAICVQNANASNSLYVGTAGTSATCKVTAGITYYINLADTNINGEWLCYNGSAGACDQSLLSYTLYR